ncbi:MAG TPA: DNA polymerase I [Dictyoglomaceae bacterium]|nr:DNA polymerase I [Dictyoglomaceae bacterium]HPP16539.1 DNA polymerase I [Dictyoglomaceae bacterium]
MEQESLWDLLLEEKKEESKKNEENKKESILLIDGSSIIYRVYYAIPPLKTKNGELTNALYGFVRILLKAIEDFKPSFLGVAFDLPEPTFRHILYKEYKAKRPPMKDDLKAQLPWIKEFLKMSHISIIEEPGYEADDLISTAVNNYVGYQKYILSGDLDLLQLVSEDCLLIHPQKGISEFIIYDPQKVKERFGIPPYKIPLYKVLVGDESDNIPGVPGIGPKKAAKILEEIDSIEDLKGKIPLLDDDIKKVIEENWELIERNLDLVTLKNIKKDIPLSPINIKKSDELINFLEKFELRSVIQKLFPDFKEEENIVFKEIDFDIEDIAKSHKYIAFKCLGEKNFEGISISFDDGEGYFISSADFNDALRKKFENILADEDIEKIGSYIQRDLHFLSGKIKGKVFDVSIASYLLNPERQNHSLEILIREYLGKSVTLPQKYAGYLLPLKRIFEEKISNEELDKVFFDIEIPLIPVLYSMEKWGIKIDMDYLKGLSKEFGEKLNNLEEEIFSLAGMKFNINSPKQLSEVLFERLKLPKGKKGKSGYSTSSSVLQSIANVHPIVPKILQYREFYKLKSTYVDALPNLIDPKTGRIHGNFNPTGTATGRLSSSEPNLQNIPIKSEEGRKIRKAFIAEEGCYFVSLDYSQIELRILAHLSQEPKLIEAFCNGEDIHRKTASEIFGVPEDQVDSLLRSRAKAVNFGIIYGISAFGLSETTGLMPEDAEKFIDTYFKHYPKVKLYIEKSLSEAREGGFVKTLFGRKRYVPEIRSVNKQIRSLYERIAINAPIQGTSADIIKLAMIEIFKEIEDRNLKSKILLQIHDELVLEVPEDEIEFVSRMAKEKMEHVVELSVPLLVEISMGKNLSELK